MIDIKEIRIGNHVANKKGERVKVAQLPSVLTPLLLCMYENGTDGVIGYPSDFEPIPLTAELLTELGFEKEINIHRSDERYHKGDIMLSNCYHSKDWGLEIDSDEYYSIYVLTNIRYLHKLENFVYLTLHKELIAE